MSEGKKELTLNTEEYTAEGYNYYVARENFTLHFGIEKGKKSLIPWKVTYKEFRLKEGTKVTLEAVSNGFVVVSGRKTSVVTHGKDDRTAGNYELERLLKELLWEEVEVEKPYDGEIKERIEDSFDVAAASFKLNTAYAAENQKQN